MPKIKVFYRQPAQWVVFRPLHGLGYRAFWLGRFKVIVYN